MKYLVDANVLSEPTKPRPRAMVIQWLRRNESELVLSPIVLGELQFGILLLPAGRKRTRLLTWFAAGAQGLPVIEFDAATADTWARLLADLKRKGRAMPIKDSLIAATARQHKLAVATRNVADYQHARVKLVNPFDG
ncbi:MAG: PIN domain-containing protein [Thermoanaerobaculales bacterium]